MVEQNHKELFLFVIFFFLMAERKSKCTHNGKRKAQRLEQKRLQQKTKPTEYLALSEK